jgi:hypothetical protein
MNRRVELRRSALAAILLAITAAGCASNPAPAGWLPAAGEVVTEPYGAWVVLQVASSDSSRAVAGELIAAHSDSVFVLSFDGLEAHSVDEIVDARVAWYDSGASSLVLWTVAGSLGSLSHGAFGIISLPLWIIIGTVATSLQASSPLVDYQPAMSLPRTISPYARFPQGLPPTVDRSQLSGKTQASS